MRPRSRTLGPVRGRKKPSRKTVGRFEEVSDHHLGASGPQGRRPVVLAADHGANRKPAIEEQACHGSPDRPKLTRCPG
jgi:hypothetical protein